MKIALVFNPFSYKLHEENIRIVQKYFGLFPPLSLAWVAAIAEQAGHEVRLIDARTLGLSIPQTIEILKKFKPDLLGFMMTTYMFRETLEWARALKQAMQIPVVVGGYNLRVYPRESLMNDVVDYGCYQQASIMFPAFLKELEGDHDFESVPGLIYRRGDEIIVNNPHPDEENFDAFPNPARHLLPNDLYAEFPTERKNFTVMVTSLGCPRGCTFCEAGGTRYAPRSPAVVLGEMEECSRQFGIREIDFFDYDFTLLRSRVQAICNGILENNLDITWACRSRIDNVDAALLNKMHAAGCRRIYYGIECWSQDTLDSMHKEITIKQIRETIATTRETGIKTLGFFLVGVPGETSKSLNETVHFAKSLNLDYAQFSKLTAKPWTRLWSDMVAETGQDYWKDFVLGKAQEQQLPRPWTSLSNDQIDRLTKRAYLAFYASPGFLWRSVKAVTSFTEFKRKCLALFDMIFRQESISENWTRKKNAFKAYNENRKRQLKKARTGVISPGGPHRENP